jgi:hypothetical protein
VTASVGHGPCKDGRQRPFIKEEPVPAILIWVLWIVVSIVLFDVLFVGARVLATRAWEVERPVRRRRR